MPKQDHTPPEAFRLRLAKCLLALVWLAIIAVCLLHKDEFTLEGILSYTPRQPILAAAMLWALFAVKSLSIFLYSGLLYAASGILGAAAVLLAANAAMRFWLLLGAVALALGIWLYVFAGHHFPSAPSAKAPEKDKKEDGSTKP